MNYLVAYNINERLYDYTELKQYIKSLGQYQHPMSDVWFVRADDLNVDDVVKDLHRFLRSNNDTVLIVEISNDADMQGWMPRAFWQWYYNQ